VGAIAAYKIVEGERLPMVVRGPITRVQIARYAGATGDFNRIHIDEPFAISSGRPSVWAHGMMGMAFLGHVLREWVPAEYVRYFKCRFMDVVYPGETLYCSGNVVNIDEGADFLSVGVELWAARGSESGPHTHSGVARVELPLDLSGDSPVRNRSEL
jgi:acyl dehydratase